MSTRRSVHHLPLALTMGEPAGIGPDIALACWLARAQHHLPSFYCIADPRFMKARAGRLGIAVAIESVQPADAVSCFPRALPVVDVGTEIADSPAVPTLSGSRAAIAAIQRAVGDVRAGAAAAVVTNPVNKAALYKTGFPHPGHTEFLGELSAKWGGGAARAVMMMAAPDLRTVPVTIHIPLADVPARLTTELIVETGRIVAADLTRRFGIAHPRLAVAGMNPHAGESGELGREDDEVVAPAVAALRRLGIAVEGPFPADTMFHEAARKRYDAALCMYHDQALIPVKTIAFADTVNVTLGLPFVRTSPDHGTAFDIAGTGKADPRSLAAALRLAAELAANEAAFEPA